MTICGICFKFWQYSNAFSPIVSIFISPLTKLISFNDVHFENEHLPIDLTDVEIFIFINDEHFWNAYPLMDIIDNGIAISTSDEHPWKQQNEISFNKGIEILFKDEQSLKHANSIDETDEGIEMFSNDEHPKKAQLSILVKVEGSTNFFRDSQL